MEFIRAVRIVVLCLIFGYVGKLVVGRVIDLHSRYGDAQMALHGYLKKINACKNDTTYHTFPKECKEAKRESERRPIVVAFDGTLRSTHSCIEYPCSDILKDFMQSWVATITLSLLLFFGVISLLIWVNNRTKVIPGNYIQHTKKDPIVFELSPDSPFLIKND